MKTTIVTALLFSFLVLGNQSTPAQSTDKILKSALKAMGGEKALRKITSTKATGRIIRLSDNATGDFQSQSARPNLYVTSYDLNGFETAAGYNGKSSWIRDSKTGLRTLTGATSRDLQVESNYRNNRWLNYKTEKSKIVYGGVSSINSKSVDIVNLTTLKGTVIRMYFDKASGLLIRDEVPTGDFSYIFDYSDFRTVDGIQEPFSIALMMGGEKHEIKLDSVVHNAQIAKSAYDFPTISNEPLPDIATLLKELHANQRKIEDVLENYGYTQAITTYELGEDSFLRQLSSRTYRLSFYQGKRIRHLIAKNGQALSQNEMEKELENVQTRLSEIEKQEAKKQARAARQPATENPEENRRVSVAELLKASNLTNPRRERFRGRDVIVFDFEPNPNFDFKNVKGTLKWFGKMAGVMWVDAQDKQMVRVEAVLAENFKLVGGVAAKIQKGAALTLENARINDEIWLPSLNETNASAKVLLFKGININQVIRYSDYQKFGTEIKESKIDEAQPKQP